MAKISTARRWHGEQPDTDPTTEFVRRCLEFDSLMAKLAAMRDDHFDADAEAVNWGDVGSLSHACERLAEVLAHYNREPNG